VHDRTTSFKTFVQRLLSQRLSHILCLKPSQSRCSCLIRLSSTVTSSLVDHIPSSLWVVWRRGALRSSPLNCTKVTEALDSAFWIIRYDIFLCCSTFSPCRSQWGVVFGLICWSVCDDACCYCDSTGNSCSCPYETCRKVSAMVLDHAVTFPRWQHSAKGHRASFDVSTMPLVYCHISVLQIFSFIIQYMSSSLFWVIFVLLKLFLLSSHQLSNDGKN